MHEEITWKVCGFAGSKVHVKMKNCCITTYKEDHTIPVSGQNWRSTYFCGACVAHGKSVQGTRRGYGGSLNSLCSVLN